ncbi:hypothetical protein BH11MYX1_BH11MYX1_13960 [soil metagenome]
MPAVATVAGLPTKLGKYELLMPLAAGGMARIYIGRSTGIGSFERHVVLKLITPERERDETAVQMFLDEARLAASLNHQNVAQVFEVGEDLGIHYLPMEYVHGQDLRALLAKAGSQGTRIPLELALTVVAGAAAGLNHAHERRAADGTPLGIVHRDVSPSNLMIGYDGSVKLLDFGIAKATARSVQTQSGIIKGKFAYMSPEQCRGRDVDRRSDVFSLGIILYEISTQHRCFRADSDFDTMHRIVTGDVVRPTRLVQGYPPALEAIVMKALAVDAAHRYQSAGLLLEALESFAIAQRHSLSTMGLARFMRDMFGESQEPWLSAPQDQPIVAAKESTISSTDGRSDVSVSPLRTESERASTEAERPQRKPESNPDLADRLGDSGESAAMTAMGMRQAQGKDDGGDGDDDLDGATEVHPSSSIGRMLPPRSQPPTLPLTPAGGGAPPQILATRPAGQQAPAGPQLPSTPAIASTRHGYASGAAVSHAGMPSTASVLPRSESAESAEAAESAGDEVSQMTLRPNRHLLSVGVGVLGLGIVIMIAMLALGANRAKDNDGLAPASDPGSAAAAAGSDGSANVVPAPVAPVADEYIKIHVVSQPKGADVLIAGSKVGITPWDGKLKHSGAVTTLAVHLVGYSDYMSKLDLAAPTYDNETITLAKLVPKGAKVETGSSTERPDVTPPETGSAVATPPPEPAEKPVELKHVTATPSIHAPTLRTTPKSTPTPKTAPATKVPRCQPPGQVNPFDDHCDGKPCPVCK